MSSTNGQQHRYRIKSVAAITGLSTHVIRKWEERYALIQPVRSENGYRTFSEEDIQILLFLQTKLQDGETIGQIAQVGADSLRQSMQQIPINLSLIPPPFHQDTKELVQAARNHNLDRIQQKIDFWIKDMGLGASMTTIIFPVLQLIGELWHQGGISISGEHHVSQLVRQYLLTAIRQEPTHKPRALVACVPGDFHEIAPLTATLFLQQLGWQATFLGANISFEVLLMALRRKQTPLMILSCMMKPAEDTVSDWIQNIAQNFLPQCAVAVAGEGFLSYVPLFKQYAIPYVETVQGIKAFSPHNYVPQGQT